MAGVGKVAADITSTHKYPTCSLSNVSFRPQDDFQGLYLSLFCVQSYSLDLKILQVVNMPPLLRYLELLARSLYLFSVFRG